MYSTEQMTAVFFLVSGYCPVVTARPAMPSAIKGYSKDEVAAYLNVNEAANFRRSFKRWTGSTPNLIRQLFNSR